MRTDTFADALVQLVHCYYPSGLCNDDRVSLPGSMPDAPHYDCHEAKLSGLIESTLGFTRLPNETLFTPVPDLVPRSANYGLGEAQLIDCLFTWHRW